MGNGSGLGGTLAIRFEFYDASLLAKLRTCVYGKQIDNGKTNRTIREYFYIC